MIKVVLSSVMILVALMASLGSFVIWQSAKEEIFQDDRLFVFVSRCISLFIAGMVFVCLFLVLALVFGGFG